MLQLDHQPRLQGLALSKMRGKGLGTRFLNHVIFIMLAPPFLGPSFLKAVQETTSDNNFERPDKQSQTNLNFTLRSFEKCTALFETSLTSCFLSIYCCFTIYPDINYSTKFNFD